MADPSSSERRSVKRISFIKEVLVVGVGVRRASDLGIGGMYIETISTFPVGSILNIRFKLDGDDPTPLDVQARVMYEHESVGIGLAFVDLPPEARMRIERFIGKQS